MQMRKRAWGAGRFLGFIFLTQVTLVSLGGLTISGCADSGPDIAPRSGPAESEVQEVDVLRDSQEFFDFLTMNTIEVYGGEVHNRMDAMKAPRYTIHSGGTVFKGMPQGNAHGGISELIEMDGYSVRGRWDWTTRGLRVVYDANHMKGDRISNTEIITHIYCPVQEGSSKPGRASFEEKPDRMVLCIPL